MRLADFIEANIEPILAEWVTFARTRIGSDDMDLTALRDHAAEMLAIVAQDLRTPQSAQEQFTKPYGDAGTDDLTPDSAAETHGAGRAVSGYSARTGNERARRAGYSASARIRRLPCLRR